ncbi:hypothetical protein DSM110093_02658 [Sulfitobacter sp. DSM 110093]|uniref:hypothetical protein n=1 Tax=Sulfitobacter sp. DSM 110093 TaxID=2883127 RepID=UPI001FAB637E|nr:hypothetical protein [Sulfitobacter sp. DSM 110093]UOA32851.1 hypothetical protein DSM110093_02658 [Sulfitobacter sp. DSM 110093]
MNVQDHWGFLLPNRSRVVHGEGAGIKSPFPHFSLKMHELSRGGQSFEGQFGVIPFCTEYRMPRHVHIGKDAVTGEHELLAERILVINGAGLLELAGELYVIPPLTLIDIAPGLPHTWTACPKGLELPDGTCSTGKFDMIYQYERPTGFTPVRDCAPVSHVDECQPYEGPIEDVFFPKMSLVEVKERAQLIWNQNIVQLGTV